MDSQYKIRIYGTRLRFPLWLFVHAYVVTEHNGVMHRYELMKPGPHRYNKPLFASVHKNLLPPEMGFLIFPWISKPTPQSKPRWKPSLHQEITGGDGSSAHVLFTFIESGKLSNYPHKNYYHMVKGPNSNTFIQWLVDQAPDGKISLPWNAWGKGYKYK